MTILVGILCQDGIVLGSDSSVTFGPSIHHKTIECWECPKVFVVSPDVVLAGSGDVGLIQRFREIVTRHRDSLKTQKIMEALNHHDIAKTLAERAYENFGKTGAPANSVAALVGFACKGGFYLYQYLQVGFQPEYLSPDSYWFASMGSGQQIVDPFLGFIGRVLFNKRPPKLKEGVFAALWALQHAIEFNTGGINKPPQIATLASDGKGFYIAKKWTDEELAEHAGSIEGVEKAIAAYRDMLAGNAPKSVPATPPPPTPPSA